MAKLSGQTIQSTYQGLLKLADSTTGITSSFQSIEDGLGNDTGMKIKNDFLTQMNQMSVGRLKSDFFGIGTNPSSAASNTTNHNVINSLAFYDAGVYSYSAITFYLSSASTANDVFQCGFYTSEMGNNGLYAKDLIISGITASTTGIGLKTYVFPNHITFSATPGVNFFLTKFSNALSLRTCNFYAGAFTTTLNHLGSAYGFQIAPNGTQSSYMYSLNSVSGVYSGITTFNSSYIESDFASPSDVPGNNVGFVLHTVK